ncbi:hypothetical protein LTS08_000135 [Lithohypha guttulata]|uniref:uncharacterized protein n=1 Tax=Lithohypha guttulata TaxID=1690604 RepID=UPI002DE1EDED|nr:hypothetical protein LTR51_007240 [Lithohypha guttulata]KAK5106019.1 hypothetical protein LTS08_000135 [Lithohypha guttulata]
MVAPLLCESRGRVAILDRSKSPSRTVASGPKDPSSWVALLDKYLPQRLRLHDADRRPGEVDLDFEDILRITRQARSNSGVHLWLWMVENGRKKALVHLINSILKDIASRDPKHIPQELPSNIVWSDSLFKDIDARRRPANPLLKAVYTNTSDRSIESSLDDSSQILPSDRNMMNLIWMSLAGLVLRAANTTQERAEDYMSIVLLVLGQLHSLGMIPDSIYTYKSSTLPSHLRRPPVLHLVCSRILTALSDATWRDQQDDAIASAVDLGLSLKEIGENVPGGRFRLKVRPLAPELWLELILWCCVDGGHDAAASSIISMLRQETENPWFAIRWCSTQLSPGYDNLIDWERLKLRHGGSVGLIEGYSREKPFVETPERTVSVEVILALVDKLLDNASSQVEPHTAYIEMLIKHISRLITFLEPHDLPSSYFDYLDSRFVQTAGLDFASTPYLLQMWINLSGRNNFEKNSQKSDPNQDLQLESILEHTLLQSGIQHQALEGFVQKSAVHDALSVFNDVQELVDRNKIRSITEFLRPDVEGGKDFFSPRAKKYRLEYADSHAQLPLYKLAGFFDLVTEAKLSGLGEWLLFSDDLDGVLIPASAYGRTSIAPALCRFASLTNSREFLQRIVIATRKTLSQPTVRVLRALLDADIDLMDLNSAKARLLRLKRIQGGSYSISNLMHLAAIVLRLEGGLGNTGNTVNNTSSRLARAIAILDSLLEGRYDSVRNDYILSQRVLFKQQVSHVLRLFAYCNNSVLQQLARKHFHRYLSGNQASLPVKAFNVFLSAYTDINGILNAQAVWKSFCYEPGSLEVSIPSFEDNDPRMDNENQDSVPFETQHDQRNDNKSNQMRDVEEEFSNNFFATTSQEGFSAQTDDSVDEEPLTSGTSTDQSVGREIQADEFLEPMPIVQPNLSTLRVIAQAHIAQRKAEEGQSRDPLTPWLVNKFRSLGAGSSAAIAQELEMPLSELDVAAQTRPLPQSLGKELGATKKTSSLWRPTFHGSSTPEGRQKTRKPRSKSKSTSS